MKLRQGKVLPFLVIVMGFFMPLLDTTIVNITLPTMTEYFATDVQRISWVINGYNLAFAVLLITASRLADQFGRKKIFMLGIFTFTFSSLFSGLSTNLDMLIFFRVMQGLAAALVVPVSIPLAVELFPPERRGAITGIWAAFAGLAAASGPTLGGILTEKFKWQSIFYVNVPIGIAVFIFSIFTLRESFDPTATRKIDWLGMTTLSVSMFTLTLSLIQANDKGWGSAYILSLFTVSAIGLVLFIRTEIKTSDPMLPMSLMKIWPFSAGSITLFILGIALMGATFLLAFFLVRIMGMSEMQAGLTITTMPLTSMLFSSASGFLSDKFGSRWFGVTGMALLTLSMYLFSQLTLKASEFDVIWRLMIAGAGFGMTIAPVIGSTIRNVPKEKVGMSSGITNMARTLGTVLGVALIVTVLNASITSQIKVAREEVIKIVKGDPIFIQQLKNNMIKELNKADFSGQNPPKLSTIIAKIDKVEKEALSGKSAITQILIKAAFERQKKELKKIWVNISQVFKTHVASAFDFTFEVSGAFVMIGILFAFFSDVPVKKRRNLFVS